MDHLYIVTYDIREPKRWRKVFRTLNGYGEWLQLSVFQCRLNMIRRSRLTAALNELVHHDEDHVLIMDLGIAENVEVKVESIGPPFEPIEKKAVIV